MKAIISNVLKEKDIKSGMKIRAMFWENPDNSTWGNVYLPLKVLQEYKRFFVCEVLSHRNPHLSFGPSRSYPMTINKIAMKMGEVVVREY